jgi:hypothetical protein
LKGRWAGWSGSTVWAVGIACWLCLGVLEAQVSGAEKPTPEVSSPPAAPPAPQAAEKEPVSPDDGTLLVALSGNRQFCVKMNEMEFSKEALKPREQRSGPLITTMGYKYQISMSRQGRSGVVKLFESPTYRTAYMEKAKAPTEYPQPRLPTEKEMKQAASQKRYTNKEKPHWLPKDTCTTLDPEYSFPLPQGRYDIYLGFDVLVLNGLWSPLQSDFVTNVVIEKGKVARIVGTVDTTNGVRTVKLEIPREQGSAGSR